MLELKPRPLGSKVLGSSLDGSSSIDIDSKSLSASSSAFSHLAGGRQLASPPPLTPPVIRAAPPSAPWGRGRRMLTELAIADLVLVHATLLWLAGSALGPVPATACPCSSEASASAAAAAAATTTMTTTSAPSPAPVAVAKRVVVKNGTFACDLSVADFGAVGDGAADDTASLQAALDFAAGSPGGRGGLTVCMPAGLYATSATLVVGPGVSLRGDGLGANPTQPDLASGSVIGYCGGGFAVELRSAHLVSSCWEQKGRAALTTNAPVGLTCWELRFFQTSFADKARLEGLVVATTFGCADPSAALGGVLVNGSTGGGVESAVLREVLIFRFTGGSGLSLIAEKGAGMPQKTGRTHTLSRCGHGRSHTQGS